MSSNLLYLGIANESSTHLQMHFACGLTTPQDVNVKSGSQSCIVVDGCIQLSIIKQLHGDNKNTGNIHQLINTVCFITKQVTYYHGQSNNNEIQYNNIGTCANPCCSELGQGKQVLHFY